MITREELLLIAPELAAKAPDQLDRAIVSAYRRMDASVFGDLLDEAGVYLAAHIASGYGVGGTSSEVVAGPIIMRKVGPVSTTYAAVGGSTSGGQQTGKGESYWQSYTNIVNNLAEARFPVY